MHRTIFEVLQGIHFSQILTFTYKIIVSFAQKPNVHFIRIWGKMNSFSFFEYHLMHLNQMTTLSTLCITGNSIEFHCQQLPFRFEKSQSRVLRVFETCYLNKHVFDHIFPLQKYSYQEIYFLTVVNVHHPWKVQSNSLKGNPLWGF